MYSEPSKIVVAGIIVSAVAIVAYVSQSGTPWVSTEDFGPARGDEPDHRTPGNMVSGVVTAGPVVTHGASGTPAAGVLPARKSVQLNDPAAAQTPRDVPRPTHKSDEMVRANNEQRATSAARVANKPQPRLKPVRTSTSPAKHHGSREIRSAAHVPVANRTTRNAQDQMALDKLVTDLDSRNAPAATPASPPMPQPAQKLPPILSDPHAELTSPASPPPAVQPTAPDSTPVQADGGPKTRAQVRSEIGRAREDGRLPAFGNPDPAGPAGAPSLTNTPRP